MNKIMTYSHARAWLTAFKRWLGPVELVSAKEIPWASATFNGTRHLLSFTVPATADVPAFEREVVEADISLRRAFVADVAVVESTLTGTVIRIDVEALVIEEA